MCPAVLKEPGRSLRGNVDRNSTQQGGKKSRPPVVPYVGTWKEIKVAVQDGVEEAVVPYVGKGIEKA